MSIDKIDGFDEGPVANSHIPLTWWQRYKIAHGTAMALQFLHTVKKQPLIHGDVKSANILLDKNMEPKLGDFGLAREGKSQLTSLKVSRVHGTKPYLPADYLRSKKLSVKVDTYSYGVVLFELCTGLRAYDENRKEGSKLLKELIDDTDDIESLRDQNLRSVPDDQIFGTLSTLAKECVAHKPSKRPDMKIVFDDLNAFGEVLRVKKISMDDISATPQSPIQLQLEYDRSGRAPSLALPYPSDISNLPCPSPVPPSFTRLPDVHHINISPPTADINSRDCPPSYNEVMMPTDGVFNLVNPLLPQLSGLNLHASVNHYPTEKPPNATSRSSSVYDGSQSRASTGPSYLPVAPKSDQNQLPLLTELGNYSTGTNSSYFSGKQPTAKNKISAIFDENISD
ncbi:Interleukin-1 receptor-associated kinase 1 [Halocaridina rubra]|uniref:non-specific serine/threonine protein kinase n=1 Tax=Halocaridina rubra TaxID=373956 RepID=A0AAN8X6I0_HALRR